MSRDAFRAREEPPPAPRLTEVEYALFRRMIRDRWGMDYPPGRRDLLAARVGGRVLATRSRDATSYYEALACAPPDADEWTALAETITNNETYFFREPAQFEVLAGLVRELAHDPGRRGPGGHVRILSAGCSSGEEPYGLAARLANDARWASTLVEIVGVDVSAAKILEAMSARYGALALRKTEGQPVPVDLERFLRREDRDWVVDPAIRRRVSFRRLNLLDAEATAALGAFDAVLCRNVLIYCDADGLGRFVDALGRLVRPGGYLFLGHADSITGREGPFRPVQHAGSLIYLRR